MLSKVKNFFALVFEVMIEADKKRAEYYRTGTLTKKSSKGDSNVYNRFID